MSVLVLLSTLSLTIEKHFCGDELVNVALFTEVDSCCGDTSEKSNTEFKDTSCCKNVVEVLEGQTELNITSFDDLEETVQIFFAAFATTYFNRLEYKRDPISHRHYRPPILTRDIHILNELT
jgi:hypothetical protein